MSKKKFYKRIITSTTQLNIRTDELTVWAFRNFCTTRQVTQNEALKILLHPTEQESAARISPIQEQLSKQKRVIAALTDELNTLRHKHAEKQAIFIKRRNDWIKVMDQLVTYIIDKQNAYSDDDREPLKIQRFKTAKTQLNYKSYHYPTNTGCLIITLHYLAYGKGSVPPLFICGEDSSGNLIKLRWYPKAEYIGISPHSKVHSYEGSQWLVGYLQAVDGATDMIAGIPLDSIANISQPKPKFSNSYDLIRTMDLEAMISHAEQVRDNT